MHFPGVADDSLRHCDRVTPRDELCVDEHRDRHQKRLDLIRTPKTIIAFAEWYNANGKFGTSASEAILQYFGEWLARENIAVDEREPDDPPPPLIFPTQPRN